MVEYVDRDAAHAEARELFRDQPTMLAALRPEDVPTSLRLRVSDLDTARAIRAWGRAHDVLGVEDSFEIDGRVIDLLEVVTLDSGNRMFRDRPVAPARLAVIEEAAPSAIHDDVASTVAVLEAQVAVDGAEAAAIERVIGDAAERCRLRPDND